MIKVEILYPPQGHKPHCYLNHTLGGGACSCKSDPGAAAIHTVMVQAAGPGSSVGGKGGSAAGEVATSGIL